LGYTQSYENSLHFSSRFQEYANGLVEELTERYRLFNKNIIEIGCGKGDFLEMICAYGENHGYGFDKSYLHKERDHDKPSRTRFYDDFYSQMYQDIPADMIICRHVLEHIQKPVGFISDIRKTIVEYKHAILYFEVPNALYTLRDLGIWDLIYEHCSYFTAPSLIRLFKDLQFKIYAVDEKYQGQFLSIEAGLQNNGEGLVRETINLGDLQLMVNKFSDIFSRKIKEWQEKIDAWHASGKSVVLWGGGSKGVSFLNMLDVKGKIDFVVDINLRKQGKFVAGAGQEIIAPEKLRDDKTDIVIIMNPNYEDEVKRQLSGLRVNSEVVVA
jgi:SAM-dependent methyltransferase